MRTRGIYKRLWDELSRDKAMIFISGPRQAGKTTFAQFISKEYINNLYFNWDILDQRTRMITNPYFFEEVGRRDNSIPLIVFDEIHKYKDWKNYLKGVFDKYQREFQFLVSGSGRLDAYQWAGDSLAGRYYHFRLWPFTLSELADRNVSFSDFTGDPLRVLSDAGHSAAAIWKDLKELSGFPEPYLSGRKTTWRRWSGTYARQIVREDIRDMTGIRSVSDLETLYSLLIAGIGSPTSLPSLSNNLKVSYNSVSHWLTIFEKMYLVFTLLPWSHRITRAIHKERKTYIWDIPQIKEAAARFENMVAVELFRAVSNWTDMGFGSFSLHYIKNKEHQEVDFLITHDGDPFLLIEAKLSDSQPSASLLKFQSQLNIPAVQLTEAESTYTIIRNKGNRLLITPAVSWLPQLP
jgi:uncharacterized protein